MAQSPTTKLSCTQWLVLDNLKHGWPYTTNMSRDKADPAYIWCVENEYIKDGQITESGLGALIACPNPEQ